MEQKAGFAHLISRQRKVNREKEYHYEQTKRVYISRAFGSDSHYRATYVDINAGTGTGKETGKDGSLSVEPETMDHLFFNVYG